MFGMPNARVIAGALASMLLLLGACTRGAASGAEGSEAGGWRCPGPVTAESGATFRSLDPPPVPSLPVVVTDKSGEQVRITDASRILALDTYGTLATTVYALGLGDRLVGRDISTAVPRSGRCRS
ncbi:MAG: hypothetical protein R2698_07970 [Microthrixaceae bacterium]